MAGISRWSAGGGTAIGDALVRAVELAGDAVGERGLSTRSDGKDGKESPVTILFLSDGRQNRGLIPPKQGAAAAKGAGIPVFTVALGTDRPDRGGFGFGGGFNRIPDRATLSAIARTTGGEYFAARSAEALSAAYHDLGSRLAAPSGRRRSRSCSWPPRGSRSPPPPGCRASGHPACHEGRIRRAEGMKSEDYRSTSYEVWQVWRRAGSGGADLWAALLGG